MTTYRKKKSRVKRRVEMSAYNTLRVVFATNISVRINLIKSFICLAYFIRLWSCNRLKNRKTVYLKSPYRFAPQSSECIALIYRSQRHDMVRHGRKNGRPASRSLAYVAGTAPPFNIASRIKLDVTTLLV